MLNSIIKYSPLIFLSVSICLTACNNSANTATNLTAIEFSEKLKEQTIAQLIDVRTPEEFLKGHLNNAINIDWNGEGFDAEVSKLDKSKPVYVYCLSGGRSASAASKMREDGFKEVYELDGGIMKWRAASLSETTSSETTSNGISLAEYNKLLITDKLVLIDFYADWCAPCKKMAPYLDELKTEVSENAVIIRINADDNQALTRELKIDALPTLLLYKNQSIIWQNTGYVDKEGVLQHLR